MTGRDPLAEWEPPPDGPDYEFSYEDGGNDRLDALRPLIAAADNLAKEVNELGTGPDSLADARDAYLTLRTPKGDTP